jgi:hypothetical protein
VLINQQYLITSPGTAVQLPDFVYQTKRREREGVRENYIYIERESLATVLRVERMTRVLRIVFSSSKFK